MTAAYLLFFGRIHPDKGTAEAIDVAERVGMPLLIAGIVQDRDYFERLVEPRLDGDRVNYVGPVDRERRAAVLGGATALLAPDRLRRAVRLQRRRGDGVRHAGHRAAARLDGARSSVTARTASSSTPSTRPSQPYVRRTTLDRTAVRASVERRFDVGRMVDDYVALYRRVLQAGESRRRDRATSR